MEPFLRKISKRNKLFALAMFAVFFSVLWMSFVHFYDRRMLAAALKLDELPGSVSSVECADYGFTDVMVKCKFVIEPGDADYLLSGYRFERSVAKGSSEDVVKGPTIGKVFEVSEVYSIWPKEFEYGGLVSVAFDKDKKNAVLDLYIE